MLLRQAKSEGIVTYLSNLFDTFFEGGKDHRVDKPSVLHMPYFEGDDYWSSHLCFTGVAAAKLGCYTVCAAVTSLERSYHHVHTVNVHTLRQCLWSAVSQLSDCLSAVQPTAQSISIRCCMQHAHACFAPLKPMTKSCSAV